MDRNKERTVRRMRRRRHIRKRLSGTAERPRLSVTRSGQHIYVQAIDDLRGVTLCAASSRSPELRENIASQGNSRAGAKMVGTLAAQKLQELGIRTLSFDRNGYLYHGRVAALADALREAGIEV